MLIDSAQSSLTAYERHLYLHHPHFLSRNCNAYVLSYLLSPAPTLTHSSDIRHSESFPLSSRSPNPIKDSAPRGPYWGSQLPKMRVAAVGLVKEAIIESLSSTRPNLFSSPLFLRVFGPILFRPSSPKSGFVQWEQGTFSEYLPRIKRTSTIGRMLGTLLRSCPAQSSEPGALNQLTSLNAF